MAYKPVMENITRTVTRVGGSVPAEAESVMLQYSTEYWDDTEAFISVLAWKSGIAVEDGIEDALAAFQTFLDLTVEDVCAGFTPGTYGAEMDLKWALP